MSWLVSRGNLVTLCLVCYSFVAQKQQSLSCHLTPSVLCSLWSNFESRWCLLRFIKGLASLLFSWLSIHELKNLPEQPCRLALTFWWPGFCHPFFFGIISWESRNEKEEVIAFRSSRRRKTLVLQILSRIILVWREPSKAYQEIECLSRSSYWWKDTIIFFQIKRHSLKQCNGRSRFPHSLNHTT